MSEPVTDATPDADPRVEVLQAVVDRVTSYEESAPTGTVRAELVDAAEQAGLDVSDDVLDRIVAHVDADGRHVDVTELLD